VCVRALCVCVCAVSFVNSWKENI